MKLIIGLGNPGTQYKYTRHNIGFIFVDFLASEHDFPRFKNEPKLKGKITTKFINEQKIILLKPQTFMNLSGESIKKTIDFYKIPFQDVVVVYDDISLDFGKIRYRDIGSAGGHNGIKSMIQYIGSSFKRVKIGIGLNTNYDVSDWVLAKFTEEEMLQINSNILQQVQQLVEEQLM